MRRATIMLILGAALLPACSSSPAAEVPKTTPEAGITQIDAMSISPTEGEYTGPQPVATVPGTVAMPPLPEATQPMGPTALPTGWPEIPRPTQPPPGSGESPWTGSQAPNFELTDVRTNQPLSLAALRGKPVFINFWGTWCPPCRTEMPEMQKMHEKYKGQVEIVGISMGPRDEPDIVRGFINGRGYSWTFVHDEAYDVAQRYQVQSVPTSYFVNKDGSISAVQIGAMTSAQIDRYMQRITGGQDNAGTPGPPR